MSDISEQLAKARAYYYENGDIGMEEMVGRAHEEIERLRAALREVVQVGIDRGVQDTPQVIAREALGE